MPIDHERTKTRFDKKEARLIRDFSYADSSEGRAIIKRYIDPLTEVIAEVRKKPPHRNKEKRAQWSLNKDIWETLKGVSDRVLALVILRGAINAIRAEAAKDEESDSLRDTKLIIGEEIWRQCRGVAIRRADKKVWATIKQTVVRKSKMKIRKAVERKLIEKHKIEVPAWGRKRLRKLEIGNWGLDCLLQALPHVFAVVARSETAFKAAFKKAGFKIPKRTEQLLLNADVAKEVAAIVTKLMKAHPVYAPSQEPPPPWTKFTDVEGTPFIRAARNGQKVIKPGMPHAKAADALKSIKWRINEPVLTVVKQVADQRRKCSREMAEQLKSRSPELTEKEFAKQLAIQLVKLTETKILKKVKRKDGWSVFDTDMDEATSLLGDPFWTEWNIDFRGRFQPLQLLNYTRADQVRGQFLFEDGVRSGEQGINELKIACATAYDAKLSRSSSPAKRRAGIKDIEEKISRTWRANRLLWAEDNLDKIIAVAEKPMGNLVWLSEAADPIVCLACAMELRDAGVRPDCPDGNPNFITRLPIAQDATCSGAQIYAMLACDPVAAKLTNLTDVECREFSKDELESPELGQKLGKLECLYEAVLQRILVQIEIEAKTVEAANWWHERKHLLDRRLIKKMGVPIFYGSVEGGLRHKVYKELRDRGYTGNKDESNSPNYVPPEAVNYLINAVQTAFADILKDSMTAIKDEFLEPIAAVLGAKGKTARWTAPGTGLTVINEYRTAAIKVPQLYLGHREKRHVLTVVEGELDVEQCIRSIGANLIHSIDAAIAVAVLIRCAKEEIDLITVHDCFAGLASYAARIRQIWREETVRLFETYDPLAEIRANAAQDLGTDADLPEIPKLGNFDRKSVLKARYSIS